MCIYLRQTCLLLVYGQCSFETPPGLCCERVWSEGGQKGGKVQQLYTEGGLRQFNHFAALQPSRFLCLKNRPI